MTVQSGLFRPADFSKIFFSCLQRIIFEAAQTEWQAANSWGERDIRHNVFRLLVAAPTETAEWLRFLVGKTTPATGKVLFSSFLNANGWEIILLNAAGSPYGFARVLRKRVMADFCWISEVLRSWDFLAYGAVLDHFNWVEYQRAVLGSQKGI